MKYLTDFALNNIKNLKIGFLNVNSLRYKFNELKNILVFKYLIYFKERCNGGSKNQNFWQTIKPLIGDKRTKQSCHVILNDIDKVICDQNEVCKIFNNFF